MFILIHHSCIIVAECNKSNPSLRPSKQIVLGRKMIRDMTFCKLRWLEVQANDISGYESSLVLGKDWGKGGPFSSVFYKLSDQCKSSRGMASWLAEPFFLLSLSVAAAAPVKNHFLLLNPKRAIPVGKISSKYFFISYRLQEKKILFALSALPGFLYCVAFSGSIWFSLALLLCL